MTDHPIAPDESGDVPRCVATCGSATRSELCDCCVYCAHDEGRLKTGTPCLPRVRADRLALEAANRRIAELVAITGRRCDGCARYTPSESYRAHGVCPLRSGWTPNYGYCESWGEMRDG